MPDIRRWDHTPREETERLLAEWKRIEPDRLAWLDDQLIRAGLPGISDASLTQLWQWYLDWTPSANATAGQPTPVWIVESPDPLQYSPIQAVACDALSLLVQRRLMESHPTLAWVLGPPRIGRKPAIDCNEPGLVVRSNPGRLVFQTAFFAHDIGFEAVEPNRHNDFFEFYLAKYVEPKLQTAEPATVPSEATGLDELVTVDRYEFDDFRWELWIDDVAASEYEDLVAQLVIELEKVPGVTGAFHADRELILVAGKITKAALAKTATEWLKARVE